MTPCDFHHLKVTLAAVPRVEKESWLGNYYKVQVREDAGLDCGNISGGHGTGLDSELFWRESFLTVHMLV